MFRQTFLSMVLVLGILISQSVPTALAATYCDQAQFVSDLTAPDGSSFAPGTAFTKTWRFRNIGTCAWTTSYNLVWVGGEVFGAPSSLKLPADVPPGQMVDLSVNLTAPTTIGNYKGLFKLSNPAGTQFGIGDSANNPFWVEINVVSVEAVIYDFVANAPYAQWKSGAGIIPFPGTSGDSRGFAYQINNPHLENDSLDSAPGLLTVPQNKFNGYIQATYPEFQIQQGDRLQTLVNCEFGATGCYVTFRVDYLLPNGVQRTLWTWKEAYDKRFYRASLDLSALAGQKVRFVFMLLATGSAGGDRAIWGSPRILRAGTTQPPAPPATLTPLPPLPPTSTPIGQPPPTIVPSNCDKAAFVSDVTVPDGTLFSPDAAFTKTWRLKNAGSCPWTTSYKLVYYSGDQMSAPAAVNLPWNAAVGQTVDISVNMIAPISAGRYRGFWILSNANGQLFGIGAGATQPIWAEINVAGEAPVGAGYDFTSNLCSAEWKSGVGALPCPGTHGASSGFILKLDAPKLEDGSTGGPGLLAAPQNRFNGYIQGFYPTFTVQPGDKFQATVGCEFGAACYLTFRLDYMAANGYIGTFWQWREQNEGKVYNASIDLTPLAGRSVRFILTVLATGNATNDRALWGSPRIVRAGGTPVPVPPTITPIPPTNDWLDYTNSAYGFQFKYPPQAQIVGQSPSSIKMNLPFVPGTNLREKYLEMSVVENVNPCRSPFGASGVPTPPEPVVINGISFIKEMADEAAAGNRYQWVAYSTLRNNACISMGFLLHSLNADNSSTPPPVFDKAAESLVFTQMMSTFGWTAPSNDWLTYDNSAYGFQIKYPSQSQRYFETPGSILIRLPTVPGTNLVEKYLDLVVLEDYQTCMLIEESSDRELVVINGINFVKETGISQGAGQIRKTTKFSTARNNACATFLFVLHSGNPDNYDPPRPVYDEAAESAVIMQMMSTFAWMTPIPPGATPTQTPASLLPDLTISQLRIELQNPSCLAPNDPMGVRAWIRNNGQAAAASFVVNANGVEQTVSGLGIGETTEVFFPGYSNPVTIMADSTNLVVESDENNNSRSEMVPVPTPPLPCVTPSEFAQSIVNALNVKNFETARNLMGQSFGFAFWQSQGTSYTPEEAVQQVPNYIGANTVLIPNPNKDLNVLLGGVNPYTIMGLDASNSLALFVSGWGLDGTSEAILYVTRQPNGSLYWNSVLIAPGGFSATTSTESFCADPRIPVLIEQLKGSMNQSNGDMFAALVSPSHGVDIRLWAYSEAVNFNPTNAQTVFTSTDLYTWGGGPSGIPDVGSFKDTIQPKLLDVLNAPNRETYCDTLTNVFPLSTPWPYPNIHYYNLYKPSTSGDTFDFRTWLIGFEYINNQPYLYAMVSIVWEP